VDHDPRFDLIDNLAVAGFVTDAEGRVIRYNQAAVALWGRTPTPGTLWSGALRLLNATGGILHPAASPVARTLRVRPAADGAGLAVR
jgi:PAS domain-containing protein